VMDDNTLPPKSVYESLTAEEIKQSMAF